MDMKRPGLITMLVGGVLVFISTFVDWFGGRGFGANAYDGDIFGFTGILLLLLSLAVIAIAAIGLFAPQVNLPDQVLGFSMTEVGLLAGIAAFVWGLSISVVDGSKGGAVLCLLAGFVIAVGAVIEQRAGNAEPVRTI